MVPEENKSVVSFIGLQYLRFYHTHVSMKKFCGDYFVVTKS